MRETDIIPVLQGEVGSLEDQPDEDRPGDHQKEFFCPAGDERISSQPEDDPIDGEDVRPPGKAVEPAVEGINFFEEEDSRKEEKEGS